MKNKPQQAAMTSPDADITAPYTKIMVKNLQLDMFIGIYDEEKKKSQRALVNIEAFLSSGFTRPDSIADTLSYEDIVIAAKKIAARGHIDLVETFAEYIADYCLSHPLVTSVKVSVEKPDVIPETESVGVEIFRTRD